MDYNITNILVEDDYITAHTTKYQYTYGRDVGNYLFVVKDIDTGDTLYNEIAAELDPDPCNHPLFFFMLEAGIQSFQKTIIK